MKLPIAGLLLALFLGGCAVNPPKPPTCDGSERRPVNEVRKTAAVAAADTCSRG
jgi:hypothetical protein